MTIDQEKCVYCHPSGHHNLGGRQFGRKYSTVTEWWNYYNQKRTTRKVSVTIMNPTNKHPHLIACLAHQYHETLFDFVINNCPFCGRELNVNKHSRDFCHDDIKATVLHQIEYFDPCRKTKVHKKLHLSLINKTGMLQDVITFRDNPKCLFEFQLNYCPRCGQNFRKKED